MASKVRDVKLKLKEINQQARDFGLDSKSVVPAALPAAPAVGGTRGRQTDSVVAPMVGRADDELNILEMLLRPSEKVVSVLPIIGMGGLGKTTLAKSIYNNQQIDGHFDKKIWVCVSKKVPIEELFKLILVQLTEEKVEVEDRNVIVGKIRNHLGGKRYFLVLDDVWDDDQALWDDFFTTLMGLNPTNGSWCLVTTRLGPVAHSVSRVLRMMENEAYPLGKLPDDHCWSILKEKVVGGEEEPDELKAIKERVIKRCDGLPLAASVIGGLLSLKRKEEWRSILEKRLSSLSASGDGVMQILQLSFDNLPSPYIKKCFAYCSIFPKDTEMEGDMLIKLWMAEGFLQADANRQMMMEEIGDYYLEILLQSSLLEEIRYNVRRYYKMHDMVHDAVKSIMSKFTKVINSETGTKNFLQSRSNLLHTLFLSQGSLSDDMLMKLKNLHVLNLSGAKNQNLPISIGKLIHLRYINVEYSTSETLPESVSKLYNLQTLRLNSLALKVLPKGMRDLISLRHLHYYTRDEAFQMPLEMGRLTCLQTLKFFNVGREKGRRIVELGSLKNLKGKLEIRNLELVKGDMLRSCASLQKLQVSWCGNLVSFPLDLQQTPSLLELGLYCCPKLKTSMTPKGFGFLTSLRKLVIGPFSDDGDDHENSSIYNEFDWSGLMSSSSSSSALRRLELYGLPHMESLPHQIQYLTTLTSLVLRDFGGIKALPDWFGNFAALEELYLIGSKRLRHLPSEAAMRSLTKLKRLRVYGSPLLKERCTPESSGPDSQWSKVSHIQRLFIRG
ncbi:unnamed protein product [Coffea canephora]|uniref:DH200=94 genomic scaffold, scaffold_4118 n=1 Tax=Coffea canephora TaxID=49390 RepID=A0A068VL55_COFCA|nr:unnamed protein product [Coffea canephora]